MLVPKKDVAEDSKYVCGLLTGEDMLSSHFHSPPHSGSNRYGIHRREMQSQWVQPTQSDWQGSQLELTRFKKYMFCFSQIVSSVDRYF